MGTPMSEDTNTDQQIDRPRAPIELRRASVGEVNTAKRTVTLVVTPYEEWTPVMWNDQVWEESFSRSAWNGIEGRPNRVKANRDHNKERTVGRALKFFPSRAEGLVSEVRMAATPLGDETLALLDDDCLGVSAGFGALPSGQQIDRANRRRTVTTAYLDHISFVEDPAYTGARVLEIRENQIIIPAEIMPDLPVPVTPSVDEWASDPIFAFAAQRANRA